MTTATPPKAGDGGTPAAGPTTTCSLHARLRVQEITFSNNHIVEKDTFGNFPSPEWIHGRRARENAPICYTRNREIKLSAKFKVTQKPDCKEDVVIEGSAKIRSTTILFKGTVQVSPGSTEVSISLTGSPRIPNKVDCIDTFSIDWNYNPASTGNLSAGTSANVLYILLGDPSGTPPYWTLLDISCRGAAGKSTEDDFVKASFAPFRGTIGDGKGFKRKHDGKEMTYYKMGGGTPDSDVYECENLLKRHDGTGRCGAWADLLVAIHRIHGIGTSLIIGAVPIAAELLIVKNCTFVGRGSQAAPFTHRGESECVKNDGIFGQGKNNPQFTFSDHALVEHSTGIYDPSYGVGPEPNLKTWEDKGIGGIGPMSPGPISFTYAGDMHFMPGVCSPGFIKHTAKVGESMVTIALKYGISPTSALDNHPYNKPSGPPVPASLKPSGMVYIPRDIAKKVAIIKKVPVPQRR